ncbi:hypothetical protein LXA43DRAFT_58510 [Ganoderma leucocontextum]|nr:hypothetical protein LXA43DRAFT_58510 [Ganoderma leucocontextum]
MSTCGLPTVFCLALPLCSKHKANNCCSGSVAFAQLGAPTPPLASPGLRVAHQVSFISHLANSRKHQRIQRDHNHKREGDFPNSIYTVTGDRRLESVAITARTTPPHGDVSYVLRQRSDGPAHGIPPRSPFPASVVPTPARRSTPVIHEIRASELWSGTANSSPIATPGVSTSRPETVQTGQITLPRDAHGTHSLVHQTRPRGRERI